MRIAVIDHGAGNLVSIARGVERTGASVAVVTEAAELRGADGVILPGVGTTAAAMRRLEAAKLVNPLRAWERPLLGICVGLQLFFETSEEAIGEESRCLGLMAGAVKRLESAPLLPHIGWNDVATYGHVLFARIPDATPFYFVHSFAPDPRDKDTVIGRTTYGSTFASAVASGLRVGVQFHPERSGDAGLRVLNNFAQLCGDRSRAA